MIPKICVVLVAICVCVLTIGCDSGSGARVDHPAPIALLEPQEIIYLRLLVRGGPELVAEDEQQEKILSWLRRYTDALISRETLPYIALGVIRKINLSTDTQWVGKGQMLDHFLDNPESIVWNTCAYNVDVFHDVLRAFEIPVRALHSIKYQNQTHATAEFYSSSEDSWVFVDVNYGSMFFDVNWRPMSFAEILTSDVSAIRFYGPFSLSKISSPIEEYEKLDKRDYGFIVENYFPLTAIRFEDQLYKEDPISDPVPVEHPRTHKGRWLVVDSSNGSTRYGDAFWRWFEQKYDISFKGQYTFDMVSIGSDVKFSNLTNELNITIGDEISLIRGSEVIIDFDLRIESLETNTNFDGSSSDDFFTGSILADEIRGLAGNDTLLGNSGPDRIYGGDGDDLVYGEDGFDTIEGGFGNDVLWGGSGLDIFSFRSEWGIDSIYDFEAGEKLDFSTSGLTFEDLSIYSNIIMDGSGNRITLHGVFEISMSDFTF